MRTEQECHRTDVESLKAEFRQTTQNLTAEFRQTIQTLTTKHDKRLIDIKSRIAIYIPVKDDAVDTKLAEYINQYPDKSKLKIMFMRESEGVYQFGSRRVMVKVDRGKISIKVGGGYLSIDEFLD